MGGLITNEIGGAISTVSAQLAAAVVGTGNWERAWLSLGQSALQMLIQMALQFVISRTVMWALNRAFGASDSAIINKQAVAAAEAWTPAAIAASTASYGAAAGFGLAAFLARLRWGLAKQPLSERPLPAGCDTRPVRAAA